MRALLRESIYRLSIAYNVYLYRRLRRQGCLRDFKDICFIFLVTDRLLCVLVRRKMYRSVALLLQHTARMKVTYRLPTLL